jgi:topoisomerase-4 subunit A
LASAKPAEAILELKLPPARLEEMKIRGENELEKERDQLQAILASERKMNNLLKKELQADADAFATIAVRRCASVKKRKR